jgi:hypothetical protein
MLTVMGKRRNHGDELYYECIKGISIGACSISHVTWSADPRRGRNSVR